jgi:putative membrane protein
MSERSHPRKPASFRLDDPRVTVAEAGEAGRAPHGGIRITPEPDALALPAPLTVSRPRRKRFPWGGLFWTALGGLVVLGLGLGAANLIEDLFARSEALGFTGIALAVLCALAFIVIVAREALALARLDTIEQLHARAEAVLASDDRAQSDVIVRDLLTAPTCCGSPNAP